MARQRLGQHFLTDVQWREQIAREIGASRHAAVRAPSSAEHCWIEVGAGHGEMTEHLVSTGARVYAIEMDPPLVARLQGLARKFANLTVVPGDVLKSDLGALAAGRRAHIYGNLPYYITSPILQHFFSFAQIIEDIHVLIQKEVAQRLAAEPGTRSYGYLSVMTQLYARPELVLEIPRGAFRPPPEVSSTLVTLRLPGERARLALADETAFLDFVKLCFSQKRKTLANNLRALAKPARLREILAAHDLRADVRAEQLSLAQFAALQAALPAAG
ncbi:MAG TPA: 16S rRNA (adenine(1518)-N(6)/adenine(1519)-N(6))-dimethyltransferase RsmA [Candidatus Acidoferrum sp.]|nr:16S rRNA (adenine(1518)-N(6)/adenine(1519)-N(6))-dimethyltransferase RsmA [Candidatus Acidoferrum sp.]